MTAGGGPAAAAGGGRAPEVGGGRAPEVGGGRAPEVGIGWWLRAGAAVLVRPGLWPTAIGQAVRLARPGWWKRAPFLPLPDRGYVHFRLQTAYGPHGTPAAGDLVAYLNWCREFKA